MTAARGLLAEPLLHSDGDSAEAQRRGDLLRLVRQHRDELISFFDNGLGYRLVVERHAARLVKLDPGADPPRPLLRRGDRAFSPRAYAMLCLLLAVLSSGRRQYLIDEVVREVRAAAHEAGVAVELEVASDRRALHAALLCLQSAGVVREREGELDRWAEDDRAQSLLDVDRDRLRLFVLGVPPVGTDGTLATGPELPSAVGGARLAIRRRLVESPLLDLGELSQEQRQWWSRNRSRETDWYADWLGLRLELRAEGALAIDPDEQLSDIAFPGSGSARHVSLLVLHRLVEAARSARDTRVSVAPHLVEGAFAAVEREFPAALSKAYRNDPVGLRSDVARVLEATGLMRIWSDGTWHIHAAAARFAPRPLVVDATLFGDGLFSEAEGST